MDAKPSIDPTLRMAAIASAEKIINTALAYDPGTRIALARLAPQVLQLNITAPSLTLYIAPQADGIELLNHYEGSVTTQLQGTAAALGLLLKDQRINLKDSGVQVMGSSHFLAELQQILKKLDIDWEEFLTQCIGDIAGHQAAELIRNKLGWARDRVGNIQRLASEFLTEELQSLPSKSELHFFYQQVDDIRLDVDRIEARILQLMHKHLP
ncbi:MAG TPA: SCP2 sterol-binding domain-containing protein [Cellvibrio sp.]|nr:SCP2 sterol-binding domain-containing protein [Cellvibrio sp.]